MSIITALLLMRVSLVFPVSIPSDTNVVRRLVSALNLLYLGFTVIQALALVIVWVNDGGGFVQCSTMLFVFLTMAIGIKLRVLASKWHILSEQWTIEENVFKNEPYLEPKKNFSAIMLGITLLSLSLPVFCNIVNFLVRLNHTKAYIMACKIPDDQFFNFYIKLQGESMFKFIYFTPWLIAVVEISYCMHDFCWRISENLCILICIWLSTRLGQLYQRIQNELKAESQVNWLEIYEHFMILVQLVTKVDEELGFIILLMVSVDLIFSCIFMLADVRFVLYYC